MALAILRSRMSEPEQLALAATYAAKADQQLYAVRVANEAVQRLHEIKADHSIFEGLEYHAARYGLGLTFEEFRTWHPVALKIAKRGSMNSPEVSEAECRRAYDIFRQYATDSH